MLKTIKRIKSNAWIMCGRCVGIRVCWIRTPPGESWNVPATPPSSSCRIDNTCTIGNSQLTHIYSWSKQESNSQHLFGSFILFCFVLFFFFLLILSTFWIGFKHSIMRPPTYGCLWRRIRLFESSCLFIFCFFLRDFILMNVFFLTNKFTEKFW